MKVILASVSPRRKELLKKILCDFAVVGSCASENSNETDPQKLATELAKKKALAVYKDFKNALVIGCDTVVFRNGEIFGKPQSAFDARRMLRELSGKTHSVFTGVSIVFNDRCDCFSEKTEVTFRLLTDEEIDSYVESGKCFDKAGSYGVQETDFVTHMNGSFYNVMGLPVETLRQKLEKMGVCVREIHQGEIQRIWQNTD